MIDKSVEGFYKKNAEEGYAAAYDRDHGPRIDFVVREFGLDSLRDAKVLDVGCGLGNFLKRLDKSNRLVGIDGADIAPEQKLCDFTLYKADLNRPFAEIVGETGFDVAIVSEVLEHLRDDYTCLEEIKKLVKPEGHVIITIPAWDCWHNWIRPGHMHPKENYEVFLRQMALEIVNYRYWEAGWQCHCWKTVNHGYEKSRMVFPKSGAKFYGKTPLEYVNI